MILPIEAGLDVLPTSLSLGSQFSKGVHIAISQLDSFMNVPGPVVMKIDVEGFEAQVLKGGTGFFEKFRPDVICELLMHSDTGEEIEAMLKPLGYSFHCFTESGLERREMLRPTRDGRDWLLTTRESLPTVR